MSHDEPEIPGRVDLGGSPGSDPTTGRSHPSGRASERVGELRGRRAGRARTVAVVATVVALAAIGTLAVWWQPWSADTATPPGGPVVGPTTSVNPTPVIPTGDGAPSGPAPSASGIRPPSPLRPTGQDATAGVDPAAIDAGSFTAWDCEVSAEMPTGELAFRGWADALLACSRQVYREQLPALATSPGEHRVRYVAGRAASACGPVDAAAFFCPGDQTIYLDVQRVRRFSGENRLAAASVVMHEYAHLVQQRLGVLTRGGGSAGDGRGPGERIRRIELQADCLTLGLLSRWRQAGWTADDRAGFVDWRFRSGDRDHGSEASRVRWLLAGLDGESFDACDTWSADASEVA